MSHYKKSCGKPHLSPGKQDFVALTDRVHPSFASLPTLREEHSSTSPNPCCFARSQTYARPMSFGQQATAYSQNGRRGAGVKVPLPLWERDLG